MRTPRLARHLVAASFLALALVVGSSPAQQQPNGAAATLSVAGAPPGPPYPIPAPGLQGSLVSFMIQGGAPAGGMPFALAFGPIYYPGIPTPIGFVNLDVTACGFGIGLDGFDPTHPTAPISVLTPASSMFSASFYYPPGSLIPSGLQALVTDPASPAGLALSAAVDLVASGPSIVAIAPSAGPAAGGTPVNIHGQDFVCATTTVTFGGAPAAGVTVLSSTLIQCTTPLGTPGTVTVVVNQPAGSAQANAAFTYAGPTLATLSDSFTGAQQQDSGFTPLFNPAPWDTSSPGQLTGVPLSGSALGPNLGTRSQITLTSLFPGTPPPWALYSPFDDAFGNSSLPGVNPLGGLHIMHLYEGVDLGSPRDALELVEWGPWSNLTLGTTYANYSAWCGLSTITAPIATALGLGLNTTYSANYDLPTPQAPDPAGLGGVLVTPPSAYPVTAGTSLYYPFPLFTPPFDYLGSGPGSGNLLLEQNIEAGQHVANLTRAWATAPYPRRRLLGPALSGAGPNPVALAGGFDIHDQRFTFVAIRGSAQSLFYDAGPPSPSGPNWLAFDPVPNPLIQPPGTTSRWELEGATALIAPNTPAPGSSTGFLTLFDGTPATGSINPGVLTQLSGNRFLRWRATLRGNNLSNQVPAYDSLLMSYLQ